MEYNEDEFLQLSGIQHFLFCRRQWALIHIEQQWKENYYTADGRVIHDVVHDPKSETHRGNTLTTRALRIHSTTLGLCGECDAVEFYRSDQGIPLAKAEGLWIPYPVEYKRGKPKQGVEDTVQLCAQALCLEEMYCCSIQEGALFYYETRHRLPVAFTNELREMTRSAALEMHEIYKQGTTPKVKPSKYCNSCSLKELCLPKIMKNAKSVSAYIRQTLEN